MSISQKLHERMNRQDAAIESIRNDQAALRIELAKLRATEEVKRQFGRQVEWVDEVDGDCYTREISASVRYMKHSTKLWRWEVRGRTTKEDDILRYGEVATKELAQRAAESALAEITAAPDAECSRPPA